MACKLTKSLTNEVCEYAVAGASAVYLANWYPPITGATATANAIAYTIATEGLVDAIALPTGESFFKIDGVKNSISFTDALLVNGNGGKYRQHTLNLVLNKFDADVVNEGDALALGTFIAAVVDNSGRVVILGRTSGLSAPAGGNDFNSGAAEADATGWTIILQGTSTEIAKLATDVSVITPIQEDTVTP